MPFDEAVDGLEHTPRAAANDPVAKRDFLLEAPTQPMRRACVISGFAGSVEMAERLELVGRVPRIEGEPFDLPRPSPGARQSDLLLGDGQDGHRHRRRRPSLPLDRSILDGRGLLIDEALNAELEAHRPLGEAACGFTGEIFGIVTGGDRRDLRPGFGT